MVFGYCLWLDLHAVSTNAKEYKAARPCFHTMAKHTSSPFCPMMDASSALKAATFTSSKNAQIMSNLSITWNLSGMF